MTKTDAKTPILTLDRGDMFAIAAMADRISGLQPGHWLSPSEIVRVAMARMLTDIELSKIATTDQPAETISPTDPQKGTT